MTDVNKVIFQIGFIITGGRRCCRYSKWVALRRTHRVPFALASMALLSRPPWKLRFPLAAVPAAAFRLDFAAVFEACRRPLARAVEVLAG